MPKYFLDSRQNLAANTLGDSVDIIMRTKDRPILLVRGLASVISQTHDNWHLYIINDGGDKKILEKTIEAYLPSLANKLTLISHDSSAGMEAASNAALSISKSDFMVVHDDDDSWHPSFLSECVQFLRKTENRHLAGVVTNFEVVREVIENNKVNEISREPRYHYREYITYNDLLAVNPTPPIAFLIRKDATDIAGSFIENLPLVGDWDYILRIMQIGDIGTVRKILAYHHIRSNTPDLEPAYKNSINNGINQNLYNELFTNTAIRTTLNKDPSLIGVFRFMALLQSQLNLLQYTVDTRLKMSGQKRDVWERIRLELKRWQKKYLKS